jgi:hypothetical protein
MSWRHRGSPRRPSKEREALRVVVDLAAATTSSGSDPPSNGSNTSLGVHAEAEQGRNNCSTLSIDLKAPVILLIPDNYWQFTSSPRVVACYPG